MMSKKEVMVNAHRVAKMIVDGTGDYQIALSFGLKIAWKYAKTLSNLEKKHDRVGLFELKSIEGFAKDELEPEFVAGVPAWAIKKDFLKCSVEDILFRTISTKVIKETAKAVQIEFVVKDENGFDDQHKTWVAKSIMAA